MAAMDWLIMITSQTCCMWSSYTRNPCHPYSGLIITQSGQAYYVNEKGIPVAQGVSPLHVLPDGTIGKSTAGHVSTPSTTMSLPHTPAVQAPIASAVSKPGKYQNCRCYHCSRTVAAAIVLELRIAAIFPSVKNSHELENYHLCGMSLFYSVGQ